MFLHPCGNTSCRTLAAPCAKKSLTGERVSLYFYKKGEVIMQRYECSVCGYVYDPADGDPESGIAPGTPFENLPDNWACPVCGATKDQFLPID